MKTKNLLMILFVGILFGALSLPLWAQEAGRAFERALYMEESEGDLEKAIDLYQKVIDQFHRESETAAKAKLHIGICYQKLGLKKAEEVFQSVIKEYPEEKDVVREAEVRLAGIKEAEKMIKEAVEPGFRIRQVYNEDSKCLYGKVSPNGRYLSGTNPNTRCAALLDLKTKEYKNLTTIPKSNVNQVDFTYVWSPDNRQIAYLSWDDTLTSVHIIGIDDLASRVLIKPVPLRKSLIPLDWKRDGRTILAGQATSNEFTVFNELVWISVKDGSVVPIKSFVDKKIKFAQISPDGKYIVYWHQQLDEPHKGDVSLMSADGSLDVPLSIHPADDSYPMWMPGGQYIIFKSDRLGQPAIWLQKVMDGKVVDEPVLIHLMQAQDKLYRMSHDGSLYYERSEEFT
ncbi:hypothetical protein BVY01_04095, partial [bacterium I07]